MKANSSFRELVQSLMQEYLASARQDRSLATSHLKLGREICKINVFEKCRRTKIKMKKDYHAQIVGFQQSITYL